MQWPFSRRRKSAAEEVHTNLGRRLPVDQPMPRERRAHREARLQAERDGTLDALDPLNHPRGDT